MATVSLVPLLLLLLGFGAAQNDFSEPIMCFNCSGNAVNSSCADPINTNAPGVGQKECQRGICLKWTKYKDGVLQMVRACSFELDFHLTMIDGVCRTERNGNGKLCMCGKHLCNAGSSLHRVPRLPSHPGLRGFIVSILSVFFYNPALVLSLIFAAQASLSRGLATNLRHHL